MSYLISVPSKTFLLGEYVALKGGPALILSSKERFKLQATYDLRQLFKLEGIHPDSPAGKLIKQEMDFYQHYHLQFVDPYKAMGGLGASSAQFIMAIALKEYVHANKINDEDLLNHYQKFAWDNHGIPPSGADLIAQHHGGICFFHKKEKIIKKFPWPFIDIDFCLIHTKNKLATHEHLKTLDDFDTLDLEAIVNQALISLQESDSKVFIESIKNYARILKDQKLVTQKTLTMIEEISQHSAFLAAKGCGALGADIILTLFNRKHQEDFIAWLKKKNLHIITYGHKVEDGLQIGVL